MARVIKYRGRPTQVPPKDPDASTKYGLNWEPYLDGETILSSEWLPDDGITVEADEFTDTSTSVILSGGTLHEHYKVTNRVTISGSAGIETEDRTIIVPIREL